MKVLTSFLPINQPSSTTPRPELSFPATSVLHQNNSKGLMTTAHVLIFPLGLQGHVQPHLKLAELLSLAGIHVTFLNSEYNHGRLLKFSDASSRFAQYPGFRFETITDGIPLDKPRGLPYYDLFGAIETDVKLAFKELLLSGRLERDGRPPVTCIIADVFYTFTIDIAKELGIPSITFCVTSASYFWAIFCAPRLAEAGLIPLDDDSDMDQLTSVPGMEGFVRHRDVSYLRLVKPPSEMGDALLLDGILNSVRASACILNTFEDLEGSILTHIRSHFSNVYALGPLHFLLDSRRKESSFSFSTNNLVESDRSCITWLDSQPPKSVIYVSFGSMMFMTENQMWEFCHGLVNSGKPFLWALEPNFVINKREDCDILMELREKAKEKGYFVRWSPQEEVLKHSSVGGFLTHAGWNSVLESIIVGIPMLCWPLFGEHHTSSRFVSEAWRIGLDMKGVTDRISIERMVRDVMEDKRVELMFSVEKMAEMGRKSINKGGSSYQNMDKLIQDIKSMSL